MPLIDYLPTDNELPDQFEPAENRTGFQFPCCACKHQDRDERDCVGCAHYMD